jgi:DNA-binding NarL/FixJ family response regulator
LTNAVRTDGQSGTEIIEHIRTLYPKTRVLVVSEEQFAVLALKAGAVGCLSKGDPDCVRLVCKAVQTILGGGKFISSDLTIPSNIASLDTISADAMVGF